MIVSEQFDSLGQRRQSAIIRAMRNLLRVAPIVLLRPGERQVVTLRRSR
jgi:hypothetical protein